MDTLWLITFPLFGLIGLGYLAGRFMTIGHTTASGLNLFVFFFALPALLFGKVIEAPLEKLLDWSFIAGYASATLLVFTLAVLGGRVLFRLSLAELGIQGMAASYANIGYIGLPLVITAFGPEASTPAVIILSVDNAIQYVLITILMEIAQGGRAHPLRWPVKIGRGLLLNPLIMAILLGGIAAATGLNPPEPVYRLIALLGSAAAPCALFALGLVLVGQKVRAAAAEVGFLVLLKLFIHPALAYGVLTFVVNTDPNWIMVAIAMAALPTAAGVFVAAQQYQTYVLRASTAILVSTVLSVVTVSVLLAMIGVTGKGL